MSISRIRSLGLVGAPLIALAVFLLVFAWGHSATSTAEAVDTAGSLQISSGGVDCPEDKAEGDQCAIVGQGFTLDIVLDKAPANGHEAFQTSLDYKGLTAVGGSYKPGAGGAELLNNGEFNTDLCNYGNGFAVRDPDGDATGDEGQVAHGNSNGPIVATGKCNDTGTLISLQMNCSTEKEQSIVIELIPRTNENPAGTSVVEFEGDPIGFGDTLTMHCVNAPTPTPPPPTPTPPDLPQMQKLADNDQSGKAGDSELDGNLTNLFLQRQGDKIPPTTCAAGTDAATFEERISIPIPVIPDPKDPEQPQQLGAFEFEVHFDDSKICVNIVPATEAGNAAENMICVVEDKDSSFLEGVARIGCVTQGKDNFPDTNTNEGRHLADVVIRPQPDVYSQAKPNQDNGVAAQLNNVGCELADLQGHPIGVFSCEDADVTIRYLEGDVEPDCQVGVVDTQAIAFRWGAQKGSLVFNDFFNLEPSGTQADNDIDIKDLQFVYGRFGSTCKEPHPAQDPVNPKQPN